MRRLGWAASALAVFALAGFAHGESGFDLTGPPMNIRVTRHGQTLPISEVPNLESGDRVWFRPDLPAIQDAHYLLVAVFLRGATNPPPEKWFAHAETWNRQVLDKGISVTVPAGAQQALFFLAPETGGDFGTLRSNVRAKPGAFVRASQDLNQASLDRSRLDAYISAVTRISSNDPASLKDASLLLSRTLDIKVDSNCFQKPASQQLTCLTQEQNAQVLDDGHTESMVTMLTSGASADLIGQLSASPLGGAGMYSPYVGAVVDVVRIMNSFHTAQYQYIPALIRSRDDQLELKLNNPPSFMNPKSVITVGLPAVQEPQLPPLRALDSKQVYCAGGSPLVLQVVGAPLVFSTSLAHNFVLHVPGKYGKFIDLPARAEADRGGFVVNAPVEEIASMDPDATGILRGYWGFDAFNGPSFQLRKSRSEHWRVPEEDKGALIVGREDTLHLQAPESACVDKVSLEEKPGKVLPATYKAVKPGVLEIKVPMQKVAPGKMTLLVSQKGLDAPDRVPVQAYAQAAHLVGFTIHAGDASGILVGTRLDQVLKMDFHGEVFIPAGLKHGGDQDQLTLTSAPAAAALKAAQSGVAKVLLDDGREMDLPVTVQAPRPVVKLLSKNVDAGQAAPASPIHLANQEELPQDGMLTFVLQSAAAWPRSQKIEVATEDGSFHALLSVENGGLTLQDANTVLARLNPLKSFGPSAFGPLRLRAIDATGTEGDWQPLGNLVRIPVLKDVHCPVNPQKQCVLNGSNLFLLDSVAATPGFSSAVSVPVGFAGSSLDVPRPSGALLYIKLRDDPGAVNTVALPVFPE